MKRVIFAMGVVFLFATCKKEVPQKQLSVVVTPNVGGSVTPSSGTFAIGSTVKLIATPSAEYLFKEWTGGYSGTENPVNIIMDADKTITCVFEKRQYPLSLTILGSGTVKEEIIKVAGASTNYTSGTTVRLTPQPTAGSQFKKWSGDDTSSKSPLDIVVSKPINLTCTFEKMEINALRIENPLDSLFISNQYKYVIKGVYTNGTTIDLSDSVKITSSSSGISVSANNNLRGVQSGTVILNVSYNNLKVADTLKIPTIELVQVDPRLKTTGKGLITVPVVIINYLPTADGIYLDKLRTLQPMVAWDDAHKITIDRAKYKILTDKIIEKNEIEEGTKYHDYSTNKVQQYANIDVVAYINVFDVKYIKVGTKLVDTTTNDNDDKIYNPVLIDWYNIDFNDLFSRIGMKYYIENLGTKEVWLTTFPREGGVNSFNVAESNMSPGLSNSTGADVSNGGGGTTDLPRYNNSYVVYGDNGFRGVDTDLHNRGHQLEAQLTYIENNYMSENILWNTGFVPKDSAGIVVQRSRLGNTHYPPNTYNSYGYWDTTTKKSDIMTWKPSGGTFQNITYTDWLNKKYSFESQINMVSANSFATGTIDYSQDAQSKWFIFWWQSIPGYNNGIIDNGKTITNWWDIFYNWDDAVKGKKKLYQ